MDTDRIANIATLQRACAPPKRAAFLDVSGFRVGAVHEYVWGNGNRDECALLCGEPVAAAIYDGPQPEQRSYTVRVTSVTR